MFFFNSRNISGIFTQIQMKVIFLLKAKYFVLLVFEILE